MEGVTILDVHTKIEDAGFNTITRNCFLRADLETVGDVLKLYNEQDEKLFCRNSRNFGSVNYQRLTNYLKENNLI